MAVSNTRRLGLGWLVQEILIMPQDGGIRERMLKEREKRMHLKEDFIHSVSVRDKGWTNLIFLRVI